MTKKQLLQTNWYDYPRYYDLAFRSETRREADFIEAACRKYCPFEARRLLEPACGTGRLVTELAARGYQMTGFDLSRPALDYLRRRLARRRLSARVFEADMADFRLAAPVDAAFCPVNTFRHLLSEQAARSHLECVAAALRPAASTSSASISAARRIGRGRRTLDRAAWADASDRDVARAWRPTAAAGSSGSASACSCVRMGEEIRLRDEFSFRMYTARQFRRLLASVPSLELCDVYDFWYEIDQPMELNDDRADTVFVLRRI